MCTFYYLDADSSSENRAMSCNDALERALSLKPTASSKPELRRRRRPLRHDDGDNDVINIKATAERRLVANARERRRMMMLNEAFDRLRSVVPLDEAYEGRRLSKYDTLQLAQCYIRALRDLLV